MRPVLFLVFMGDSGLGAMSRAQRWQELLRLVADHGRLSVPDAAQAVRTSEATIRRDFSRLAEAQLVTRTHGGVVATAMAYALPGRHHRDLAHTINLIAMTAAAEVTPGQVVGLSGRRTAIAVARHLGSRRDLADPRHRDRCITVVTNTLTIATDLVLRPHLRTVCLGGVARAGSVQLTGSITLHALENYWLDVLFLDMDGVHPFAGVTAADGDDAMVWAKMVQRAQTVIAVVTGSRVGRRALAHVCPVADLDRIITDPSAEEKALCDLRAAGVQVDVIEEPARSA